MKKRSTLVWAFAGTGKSKIQELYENAAEESLYSESAEIQGNFVNDFRNIGKDVVMEPFACDYIIKYALKWGNDLPFDFWLAYPTQDCIDEYEERYRARERGNQRTTDRLVSGLIYELKLLHQKISAGALKGFKHPQMILRPNQYLDSAFQENGIYLKPKQSIIEL